MKEFLTRFWGQDTIVLGNLNTGIGQAHNISIQQISYLLKEFGLVDLLHHFQKRRRFHHLKM